MKSLGLTLCAWIAAGFLTFPSAFSPEKSPQWPLFQKHLIDAGASESAAVADINRDARPDIISGENWYEAPEWKKHQLREINPNYGNSGDANGGFSLPIGPLPLSGTQIRSASLQVPARPNIKIMPGQIRAASE